MLSIQQPDYCSDKTEQFLDAIVNQDVDLVRELVSNPLVDVNSDWKIRGLIHEMDDLYTTCTCLGAAAVKDSEEILQLMLSSDRVDVNAKFSDLGETVLHFICAVHTSLKKEGCKARRLRMGNARLFDILQTLENRLCAFLADPRLDVHVLVDGWSLLDRAFIGFNFRRLKYFPRKWSMECARIVYDDGRVQPTDRTLELCTPDCEGQDWEMATKIFEDARLIPTRGTLEHVIDSACHHGAEEAVCLLLQGGILQPTIAQLEHAGEYGDAKIAQMYLDYGVQPSERFVKLCFECFYGDYDGVWRIARKVLQEGQVPPTEEILQVCCHSRQRLHRDTVVMILDRGVKPTLKCLEACYDYGNPDTVEILLSSGHIQPTVDHIRAFYERGHVQPAKEILHYVGRRLRDDSQNIRRVANAKQFPKDVVDHHLLPLLKQTTFPADYTIKKPLTRDEIEAVKYLKRFFELFGDVDDFEWPDLSPELEKQADHRGRLPGHPSYNVFNVFDADL